MARTGRPTDYSPELAKKICAALSGGMSLRRLCMQDDMPNAATVYDWLWRYPDFNDKYARAKEDRAESYADEIAEIADNQELDPNSRRVMIDARKWVACKFAPRKYGDKVTVAGDKDAPLEVKATLDVSALSTAALAEIAALAAKGDKNSND